MKPEYLPNLRHVDVRVFYRGAWRRATVITHVRQDRWLVRFQRLRRAHWRGGSVPLRDTLPRAMLYTLDLQPLGQPGTS